MALICSDKETVAEHKDKFENTAMHFAARDGYPDICSFLMKKYPRLVKMKNQEGKSPLSYA